jgi:hypothetical protein
MTPGEASRAGKLLIIYHPIGGKRIAPHVFDLKDDGIAFIDDGWTAPMVSYHVAHIVAGKVFSLPFGSRRGWCVGSEDGEVIVEVYPGNARQEGDRDAACNTILIAFPGVALLGVTKYPIFQPGSAET